jgi:hypothetical protein
MVSDTANTCRPDTVFLGDAAQVWPQTFSDLRAEYWNTLFGTKNAWTFSEWNVCAMKEIFS